MAVAEVHPSVEELVAFTLGSLDDETHASIEAHVASCTSCQERAAKAPGDSFVELLRSVHARTGCGADPVADVVAQALTTPPLTAVSPTVSLAPDLASSGQTEATRPEAHDAMPPELARHERYRVVRLIGQGGMGAVYEAEHRIMQRPVALKVINRAYTAQPGTVERFRREVRAAARLSHPNIVTTYDAEDACGSLFLVMEYVEGVSLARLIKERSPLPVAEACAYIRQAALGLQHAHERGMVHRDVKPDNLILVASPNASEPGVVKVLDFGLAALTAERGEGLTEENVVMRTPEFMAPEQAEDPRKADIRADVYSLGCTLYFLLTGKVPYPASTRLLRILAHREQPVPSIRQARPEVSAELARVLERMLAKKPADRYATPGEVAAALRPYTQTAALPLRARRPRLVAIALAALFGGLLVAGGAVYRIATDKGEVVIETEGPDVEVVVKQGGKVVTVLDARSKQKVTLNTGEYTVSLGGNPDGLKIDMPETFILRRGDTKIVTVKRVEEKVGEIRRFEGHTEGVGSVAYAADGRRALSGSNDNTVRLWDVETGKELRRFEGHADHVTTVAISPNGRLALSASKDGTARLWDTESGKELRRLEGHGSIVCGVALSPDGRRALTSCMGDGDVRLWDVETGKELRRFVGHDSGVWAVAFSPDGRRALTGCGRDHTMRLWDVNTGRELRRLEEHAWDVQSVAFSPDGRRALSGSWDKTVRLWNLETGKELRRFERHANRVISIAFSPDGRRALSGSWDETVRLWEVESGRELYRFNPGIGKVESVAFSPDGRLALIGGWDEAVRLWRLPDPPAAKDKP